MKEAQVRHFAVFSDTYEVSIHPGRVIKAG